MAGMSPRTLLRLTILIMIVAAGAAPAATPGDSVIGFLNHTIDWYRRIQAIDPSSGDSQDLLLRATVRDSARQATRLALQFAHGEASILEAQPTTAPTTAVAANRNMAKVLATINA